MTTREMVSGARAAMVWLVVVANVNQERRARHELQEHINKGRLDARCEVYLPERIYQNRKGELVRVPFLARYVFLRIDVRVDSWKRVWSTPGVHGILGASASGKPYGVADWVIERIKAQEEGGFIKIGLMEGELPAPKEFTEGEVVRAAGSPLEMIFEKMLDAKRASVFTSLLGRERRATVDISKLRSTTE